MVGPNIERTLTFEGNTTVSRSLTLLLVFDFTSSDVKSTKQEQYSVVWKILQFSPQKLAPQPVAYTSQLAFTKAEATDPEKLQWKVNAPTIYKGISSRQQTMLIEEPKGTYKFTDPTNLPYEMSVASNATGSIDVAEKFISMAFGFYEKTSDKTPTQVLYFHGVPKSRLLSLDFKPVLNAYFVPQDYYVESQILTLPIPSPLALEVDLRLLSEKTGYVVSISGKEANITLKG